MTRIRQRYKGNANKVNIKSNYPNRKVSLKVNRRTRIKVRRA